jgi:hypothetical protein
LGETDKKAEENYLVFEAGGYPLAIRISQVRKVLTAADQDPNLEKIDLGKILHCPLPNPAFGLELVVKNRIKSVLVNRVEPIKDLRLAVWLSFPELMRRKNNRLIEGFFFDGARMISLINFELADN